MLLNYILLLLRYVYNNSYKLKIVTNNNGNIKFFSFTFNTAAYNLGIFDNIFFKFLLLIFQHISKELFLINRSFFGYVY